LLTPIAMASVSCHDLQNVVDRGRSSNPIASLALSYGALKLLPFWDPLRGNPRFEKIVASLAPKEASK
jgi:hypothetical protein